jgi:hypothetical protein
MSYHLLLKHSRNPGLYANTGCWGPLILAAFILLAVIGGILLARKDFGIDAQATATAKAAVESKGCKVTSIRILRCMGGCGDKGYIRRIGITAECNGKPIPVEMLVGQDSSTSMLWGSEE